MGIQTVSQTIKKAYLQENYPMTKIVNCKDDPREETGLMYAHLNEIDKTPQDWFPLGCKLDENGQLIYWGENIKDHFMVVGDTGAGKTTGLVIQDVFALLHKKEKPSMLINDMDGSINKAVYKKLKEKGYRSYVVNCDDPMFSDLYNILGNIAQECLVCRAKKIPLEQGFSIGKNIRRVAGILQPIESKDDPIWDRGACDMINGLLWDLVEDLYEGAIPVESFNTYNLIQRYYWLRGKLCEGYGKNLREIPHYAAKNKEAMSLKKLSAVCDNNEKTRASYFGVVENHNAEICDNTHFQTTYKSTIDIAKFVEEPSVIFLQCETTDAGDLLISILANDIYHYMVSKRKSHLWEGKCTRKVHMFLDEFANSKIAEGTDLVKMLTTSRKYGLFFYLFLQADSQLESKYNQQIAQTIRNNCTEIFLGSRDNETLKRVSAALGRKTIETYDSMVAEQGIQFTTVEAVPPEKLREMPQYHCYIRSAHGPILYSYYEPYYNCFEIEEMGRYDEVYPKNTGSFKDTFFDMDNQKRGRRYDEMYDMPNVELVDLYGGSAEDEEDEECESDGVYTSELFSSEELLALKDLTQLQIIPEGIIEKMKKYSLFNVESDRLACILDVEIQKMGGTVKYEILEVFIKSHSCDDAETYQTLFLQAWKDLQGQVNCSSRTVEAYQHAQELLGELTIDNIREIKKIIEDD